MVTETLPTTRSVSEDVITALADSLHGNLIQAGEAGYDEARAVYNAMIDKYPALIVRCRDVADVIAGVNFARDQGLLLSIRGGGHNGAGMGTVDAGLVLDLGLMHGVRVDPMSRTARVEGGALLSDLHHATAPFGLAMPSGIVASTGVGGITLGGGIGHLTRQLGLSIDNLLEADVVLADGSFVVASETEHPDLFWAVRGGGGNFGVVTSFLFKLHPISTLYAGPMLWPLERAAEVLRWYREFIVNAPETLNGFFAFLTVPPALPFPEHLWNQKVCGIVWSCTLPQEQAEATFAPIRARFGQPALDGVGPVSHQALQSMFDALYPAGEQWYWKSDFVNEIPDAAVDLHVQFAAELPTWKSTMHLYPIDGVAGRVPREVTAWNYRDAHWGMVIIGVSRDPADNDRMTAWAREYWSALHPYSAGGAYVNMMMEEGQDRVRACYGEHYDRLARIKAKYDPDNLFQVNQNIKPA
jgi:FAD/FMN-containing dehydrogenase